MTAKKLKLLIVDDEKDICNFIKLLFRNKGFSVYSAFSGAGALRIIKKVKPQIVLLDIYLKKGIDGLGVLKQIRKISPRTRCVMVTWDKARNMKLKAMHLGAIPYLTKPLTVSQLYKAVNQIARVVRKRGA